MAKDINHDYVKQLIVNRLRRRGCPAATEVFTPKSSKQGQRYKIDIVALLDYIGKEICIIEVKIEEKEISYKVLERAKIIRNYAHKTYFCLPDRENFTKIAPLCSRDGIGLLAVNTCEEEDMRGYLYKIVESDLNKRPKKWDGLYRRLRDHYSYF